MGTNPIRLPAPRVARTHSLSDGTLETSITGGQAKLLSLPGYSRRRTSPANVSSADLLADLQEAITASTLSGKISASLSGGVIRLNPQGSTTAIEIISADDEAEAALGFADGQKSTQRLAALNTVSDPSLSDGNPNTSDEAHIEVEVVTTGGTTTTGGATSSGTTTGS